MKLINADRLLTDTAMLDDTILYNGVIYVPLHNVVESIKQAPTVKVKARKVKIIRQACDFIA